ncbi:alkaline phosphatase family protein [Ferrimicrobium sp.]|uniref:alkaline phosphatase family protein n=1 Tax=Ferrimicrobium sp. TaxID=2926050 RepID=UPI0026376DF7|nr:alkaline phosphatase family protein [Ferrimicrobium sp.]
MGTTHLDEITPNDSFVVPDYTAPGLATLMPTVVDIVRGRAKAAEEFLGVGVENVDRIVVLALDGLGFFQLQQRLASLPILASGVLRRGYSVGPTTTATALTSLTTGATPAEHGVLGYRVRLGSHAILNTLRWSSSEHEAPPPNPIDFQPVPPFCGETPAVVTKYLFAKTGFTQVHLRGGRLRYWHAMSSIVAKILAALKEGEPLVFAYYDGIDTVAHEFGLGDAYERELVMVDMLVGMLMDQLPTRTALVITADHGQVEVPKPPIRINGEVMDLVKLLSGEGRFRWLHCQQGATERVADIATELYGDVARVLVRNEVLGLGIFGGTPSSGVMARVGDVAIVPTAPVSFYDPADIGALQLICRHGGLTAEEVIIPILTFLR